MDRTFIVFAALCLTLEVQAATQMKCQSSGKTYNIGDMYSEGPCDLCTCEVSGPSCTDFFCELGKREQRDLKRKDKVHVGKRDVATCVSNGVTYQLGETLTDGCRRCICNQLGFICLGTCETPLGKREVSKCVANGVTYHMGETYSDGCNDCMCDHWGPICTANFCGGPLKKRDNTCVKDGVSYALGETFSDGCHYCHCTANGLACLSLPCGKRGDAEAPAATCTHNGKVYSEAQSYVQYCDECTCTGGNWKCDIYWMCELGR